MIVMMRVRSLPTLEKVTTLSEHASCGARRRSKHVVFWDDTLIKPKPFWIEPRLHVFYSILG